MTVKGIYKDGVIHLLEKTNLKEDQEVIILLDENDTDQNNTIPSFEEFKANVTGDFLKFNDEALRGIYEGHYRIGVTKCKDIEDLKRSLESDED